MPLSPWLPSDGWNASCGMHWNTAICEHPRISFHDSLDILRPICMLIESMKFWCSSIQDICVLETPTKWTTMLVNFLPSSVDIVSGPLSKQGGVCHETHLCLISGERADEMSTQKSLRASLVINAGAYILPHCQCICYSRNIGEFTPEFVLSSWSLNEKSGSNHPKICNYFLKTEALFMTHHVSVSNCQAQRQKMNTNVLTGKAVRSMHLLTTTKTVQGIHQWFLFKIK